MKSRFTIRVIPTVVSSNAARYKVYEQHTTCVRSTYWPTVPHTGDTHGSSLPASCAVQHEQLLVQSCSILFRLLRFGRARGRGWGCGAICELPLINTISNMHHPLLNAILRGRIPNKMQHGHYGIAWVMAIIHGHRPLFLRNRICYYVCTDLHRTLTGAHPRVAGMHPSR